MGIKKSTSKYSSSVRIRNKTRKLEKRIEMLEVNRKKEPIINPNTKTLPIRRDINNVKRDCKIGRVKEGFKKEDFKFQKRKNKVLELGK